VFWMEANGVMDPILAVEHEGSSTYWCLIGCL
jgi:hypothetical protein